MAIVEFTVNLNDPKLADFLAKVDPELKKYVQGAVPPTGFLEHKRRPNHDDKKSINAPFLVREIYRLQLGRVPQGTVAAEVFLKQKLSFSIEYVLYLKGGLPQDVVERARKLVDAYEPGIAPNLSAWIDEQIKDGWLAEEDMALLADIHIEKEGVPSELNTAQRDALFDLYGIKTDEPPISTRIDVLPETTFQKWAHSRAPKLELIGKEAVRQNEPQVGREIAEISKGQRPGENAKAEIGTILEDVSRHIIPVECRGGFRRQELRLCSVFQWPEFMIEWMPVSIPVGCATITFSVPQLKIRFSHLVVFIYFHFPERVDEASFTIAKNCAIRSALAGTVIGIVVGNPAAAVTAFQSYFLDCLRQDAYECVNPGLLLVKETEEWKPAV